MTQTQADLDHNQSAFILALCTLLIDKGIITDEELLQYRAKATHKLDETTTRNEEEWREANPKDAEMVDVINKIFGEAGLEL